MPIYEQIPIRLQVSLASAPPVPPVDANTGSAPQFWRAQNVGIQVGIFDAFGNSVDLSNLSYLQLTLQQAPDSLQPLFSSQVPSASIYDTITSQGWEAGTEYQALFSLTPSQTDVSLGGLPQAQFWMILSGQTAGGNFIVYSAGWVTVFNASSALPFPAHGLTSRNAQTTDSGDFTVTPLSQLHKEIVTVGGAARTVNGILGIAGVQDGAELTLVFLLTSTPGINLNLRSGQLSNPVISQLSTGSVLQCRLKYYFDADAAGAEFGDAGRIVGDGEDCDVAVR